VAHFAERQPDDHKSEPLANEVCSDLVEKFIRGAW
jgi:hypothetical protein